MRTARTLTAVTAAGVFFAAGSFGADTKLLKAVSDHVELYTTENEAAAKAALQHFEMARAYLIKSTGGRDPFSAPIRIVEFKSLGDFNDYKPKGAGDINAFAFSDANRITIVMAGLKKEAYENAMRNYVSALFNRAAPKLPYWLRLGFSELYCSLFEENGQVVMGTPPFRSYRSTSLPELNMSVLMSLKGSGPSNKGAADFNASEPNRGGGLASTDGGMARSSAFGAADGLDQIASQLTTDYPMITYQLTHMLMFKKEYSPKFGQFVNALSNGEESAAALNKVYGQSLDGLGQDLVLYWKLPSHMILKRAVQLEKPLAPQFTQLSAPDSAPLLNELKAAR